MLGALAADRPSRSRQPLHRRRQQRHAIPGAAVAAERREREVDVAPARLGAVEVPVDEFGGARDLRVAAVLDRVAHVGDRAGELRPRMAASDANSESPEIHRLGQGGVQ